ncbi:hypothetical protein [Geopseudomonas aromaticivorans]
MNNNVSRALQVAQLRGKTLFVVAATVPGVYPFFEVPLAVNTPAEALDEFIERSRNYMPGDLVLATHLRVAGRYTEDGDYVPSPPASVAESNLLVNMAAEWLVAHPQAASFADKTAHDLLEELLDEVSDSRGVRLRSAFERLKGAQRALEMLQKGN